MKPAKLYCRLCWQEFDRTEQHDAPSLYNRQRLNGHCPGDIRPLLPQSAEGSGTPQTTEPAAPPLLFD